MNDYDNIIELVRAGLCEFDHVESDGIPEDDMLKLKVCFKPKPINRISIKFKINPDGTIEYDK